MAVAEVLKNWFLKLDDLWAWITPLLPDFSLGLSEKQAVLDWVANYVTQPPKDFSVSWRDGILLCELADKFSPDLFHGHGILDPKNCFHNVSLALEIIKGSFDIDPGVLPEDIVICSPEAEGKLLNLLLKLKERVESAETENAESLSETDPAEDECPDPGENENDSFARGTGLETGFLGRKASFIVFSNGSLSDPDLVVEIKGPADTYCCERVTKRSPKRKSALPRSGTPRSTISQCGGNKSQTELWAVEDTPKNDPKMIPLEYEIKVDFIFVGYIPLKTGLHTINIIWRGRYVTGCPFVAMVQDSLDVQRKKNALLRPPILRKDASETISEPKKHSVRFKEPETNKMKLSNVRSRRVLRYIVRIGKEDVVVEAQSSDMLASALQKLDFPDKGTLLGPRRNSWGFVGDIHSQRRLSLMRQVGIDVNDEDQCRGQKRSFSIDLPLSTDTEDPTSGITNLPASAPVNSALHEHALNNISASDFNKGNNSTSSKLPRLETVSEPFVSFTSDVGAETEDKIDAPEDEVFYEEQHPSLSATLNLTAESVFPKHYTSEIFYEINKFDPEERKTGGVSELDTIEKDITRTQSGKISPSSAEVEKKSCCEKQENDSLEMVLCDKTASRQYTDNAIRMKNPPEIRSTDNVCSLNSSENLSEREEAVFGEFRKCALSGNIIKDCIESPHGMHKMHTCPPKENTVLLKEINILSGCDQSINEADKYYDRKTMLLSPSRQYDQNNVLCNNSQVLELKGDTDGTVNGSNTTAWHTENTEGDPQYCSTFNFEDVSMKQNILDKPVVAEELYVSKVIASFNRTNTAHNEVRLMSNCSTEPNENDQKFPSEVHCDNFQEEDHDRKIKTMPSHDFEQQCSFQFRNHDTTSGTESDSQSGLGNESEAQGCFSLATKSTKSESTLKFGKTRRILSHPYLKSTCHKLENSHLTQISYPTSERDTKSLDSENIEEGESSPGMKTDSESNFSETGRDNSTESRECHSFFTWPGGFSNSDKKSVLYSDNMKFCLPENNGYSFEMAEPKIDEIPSQKPVVGETLRFSLRSYKDKYRSPNENEIIPSNSVRDIVKDFHSRSLEYPAPRSDKTNNIYLRRSFFPPLASNEGRKTVKNRISKWEKFPSMPETEHVAPKSNKSSIGDKLSLYVNVQSKVAFWETAYHGPESGDIPDKEKTSVSSSVCAEKCDLELKDVQLRQQDRTGFDSMRDSDNAVLWEAQPHRDSSHPVTSERTEDSGISDDLLMCLKTSDHKRPPMLLRHRSLSDPCIRTSSTRVEDFLSNFEENMNVIPSPLYCSSEEESEDAVRDSEDGNDEYIDDEIPDYAAMFLGDYISFTGLLGPERSSLRKEAATQYLQKLEDKSRHIFDPSLSRPHECRALGVGVHYGLVSMNNHFQVLTKGAGRGNLSVSIQGSGRHDVTKIILTYSRNDIYDVIYQVLEPGYYIISVRWSDWSIPGSPFICKVTY